jgi:integrase
MMGLHWDDVDYVNRRLQIRRGRVQDCAEARLKTAARKRDQDLPEWAFQELLRFRETTEKEGQIFKGAKRKPLNICYFERAVFKPVLGTSWRGFHAARHAFATDLAASGVPRATLQELMGHKPGSAVTESFYVHATEEHRTKALALLEQRKPN